MKHHWVRVSDQSPCPVCKKGDWCGVTKDGAVAKCMRVEDGCFRSKEDGNGQKYFLHRVSDRPESSPLTSVLSAPLPGARRADTDTLHAVYTALLADSHLKLSAKHHEDLRRRGLPDEVIEVKTKTGQRTQNISRRSVLALVSHRQKLKAAGFDTETGIVFPNTEGGFHRYRNVYHRDFLPLVKKAGVPRIRPYDMRHTCATILLIHGVNIKVVSERLGHSNIRTTLEHYAKVLPGMQAIAAKAFDDMMGEQPATNSPNVP